MIRGMLLIMLRCDVILGHLTHRLLMEKTGPTPSQTLNHLGTGKPITVDINRVFDIWSSVYTYHVLLRPEPLRSLDSEVH